MCSIIGYCGICDDLDEFQKGFDKTISRGPDDSRIVDTGNGLLGFHRLAIMGSLSVYSAFFSIQRPVAGSCSMRA